MRRSGHDVGIFLSHHNLKAPDEVAVFSVPARGIRRWDAEALVYDVRVSEHGALRHYAFFRRWFQVNVTLDLEGRFVPEPGPIDWCFNCDVSTPIFTLGPHAYSMDLELDVLAAPDGQRHVVVDEDEFAHASRQGWITEIEQAGAWRGLEELLGRIQSGTFLAFLEAICPFAPLHDLPLQPPVAFRRLADVPRLHPEHRARYHSPR
jgi:hypothetical protein